MFWENPVGMSNYLCSGQYCKDRHVGVNSSNIFNTFNLLDTSVKLGLEHQRTLLLEVSRSQSIKEGSSYVKTERLANSVLLSWTD